MIDQDRQVENESTLVNQRIVLLGGSSGIGLAVAQQVVAQGRRRLLHQAIKRVQQAADSLGGTAVQQPPAQPFI